MFKLPLEQAAVNISPQPLSLPDIIGQVVWLTFHKLQNYHNQSVKNNKFLLLYYILRLSNKSHKN